jgi:hypothetical protein
VQKQKAFHPTSKTARKSKTGALGVQEKDTASPLAAAAGARSIAVDTKVDMRREGEPDPLSIPVPVSGRYSTKYATKMFFLGVYPIRKRNLGGLLKQLKER